MDFLHDLSNRKPWVYKGDSNRSKLIRELSWEGKMFGSFTQNEVEVVKRWIDSMAQPGPEVYYSFVAREMLSSPQALRDQDIRVDYPVLQPIQTEKLLAHAASSLTSSLDNSITFIVQPDMSKFLPLWFCHPCLLENFVSTPFKVANSTGSAVIRLLRAQSGFREEGPGVAGMDEVRRTDALGLVEMGLEMMERLGLPKPCFLKEVLDGRDEGFAITMLHLSMKPMHNAALLLGMAWAFKKLHEALASAACDLLTPSSQDVLRRIALRERESLEVCLGELRADEIRYRDFCRGVNIGRSEIEGCFKQ
jgi:hypothetical protein